MSDWPDGDNYVDDLREKRDDVLTLLRKMAIAASHVVDFYVDTREGVPPRWSLALTELSDVQAEVRALLSRIKDDT